MTTNRRIFLNIIATYGRRLYALALGLMTARWALEALGVSDYGIMGVVGGLVWFVSFFNGSFVGRFCAIFIGKMMTTSIEFEARSAPAGGNLEITKYGIIYA